MGRQMLERVDLGEIPYPEAVEQMGPVHPSIPLVEVDRGGQATQLTRWRARIRSPRTPSRTRTRSRAASSAAEGTRTLTISSTSAQ